MNKIIIDGKEHEISAELAEKIKAEVAAQEKAKNPFERCVDDRYRYYYFIDTCGEVSSLIDTRSRTDDAFYSAGNYCRDKGLMEQRALHETLNRLLWRYSETHGGDNPWDGSEHYYIYNSSGSFYVDYNDAHQVEGVVYFKWEYIAVNAITEVVKPFMAAHPEFVW